MEGPMLKSFGIEVADIAQLPRSVVDSAKNYLSSLENTDIDDEDMSKVDDMLNAVEKEKSFSMDMLESLIT